ncbi:MAG: SUF system Fe-S cluster assembly protein [Geminicoccaceae bacterium]
MMDSATTTGTDPAIERAEAILADEPATQAERERLAEVEGLGERIIEALRTIYDPEIPVNIYELGLVYKVDVEDDNHVLLDMTLTSPNCPVAESLPGEVELKVAAVEGVEGCEVRIVWDPPWTPAMMTEEAQLELGMIY